MHSLKQFVNALNDFIHTWLYAYTNVELKYVQFDDSRFEEEYYSDYMYIIWANGRQSRMYISESSEREILKDFLDKHYEDVPEDEYI